MYAFEYDVYFSNSVALDIQDTLISQLTIISVDLSVNVRACASIRPSVSLGILFNTVERARRI